MSVSTSDDPVQTVVDILEDASTWTEAGSAPDKIERYEETNFSRKQRRDTLDAIYVIKPDAGTSERIGANYDPFRDEHVVRAEVWTPTSHSAAHNYFLDVRSIVNGYVGDNKDQTTWTQIATIGDDDLRGSKRAESVDHYIYAALIELIAPR